MTYNNESSEFRMIRNCALTARTFRVLLARGGRNSGSSASFRLAPPSGVWGGGALVALQLGTGPSARPNHRIPTSNLSGDAAAATATGCSRVACPTAAERARVGAGNGAITHPSVNSARGVLSRKHAPSREDHLSVCWSCACWRASRSRSSPTRSSSTRRARCASRGVSCCVKSRAISSLLLHARVCC